MSSERAAPKVADSDLPALYKAADNHSAKAQKNYLWLVKADLLTLIAAATLTAVRISGIFSTTKFLREISVFLLICSAALTFLLSLKRYRREWYGARAIAESIKTLSWRFMMRSEPFNAGRQKKVERAFLKNLSRIRRESETLSIVLNPPRDGQRQITEQMLAVRAMNTNERKWSYEENRIGDQREWYSKKSRENDTKQKWLFGLVITAQGLAIVAAVSAISTPGLLINFTGVLSTVAAGLMAWLQVQRHEELAQSYATAAYELSMIAEEARDVAEENEFAGFVADAENAISREHTLWIARRDHLPNLKPYT